MQYVEVKKRDGLARLGIFQRPNRKIVVPCAVDVKELFPNLKSLVLSNVPLSADPSFVATYFQPGDDPIAVHPHACANVPHGSCIMVSNWHTALGDPKRYVTWLITLKEGIPPDTIWYSPAAALPSTVNLLVYSGFDMFDFMGVDLKSIQGLYCTPEGEFPRTWMEEGMCDCEGCRTNDLFLHNRTALTREIVLVSRFIERSQLRELVESRSRLNSSHVAILRHLDEAYSFLEKRVPLIRHAMILASSSDSIRRIEVRRFAERVVHRYLPLSHDVAVLLPCSARKPYSLSRSHRKFIEVIDHRAHELIVTSPLGLVPRDLERVYPAAHYDVPVTGYWDREELSIISNIIAQYFEKHRYRRIIAHLDGGAQKAVELAADQSGMELEFTCIDHPTSDQSLRALGNAVSGEQRLTKNFFIHGIISWQFGKAINTEGMVVLRRTGDTIVSRANSQLFSFILDSGLCIPTFEGWELLGDIYRVHIDDFIPHGDILAAGVAKVDPLIREGDEVFVVGGKAIATGKAAMGAVEMVSSKRGIAVKVRKVLKC